MEKNAKVHEVLFYSNTKNLISQNFNQNKFVVFRYIIQSNNKVRMKYPCIYNQNNRRIGKIEYLLCLTQSFEDLKLEINQMIITKNGLSILLCFNPTKILNKFLNKNSDSENPDSKDLNSEDFDSEDPDCENFNFNIKTFFN